MAEYLGDALLCWASIGSVEGAKVEFSDQFVVQGSAEVVPGRTKNRIRLSIFAT